MVSIKYKLPAYTVFRVRKSGIKAFYFRVPKHIRPENWPADIALGREDEHSIEEIIINAKTFYTKLKELRESSQLGKIKTCIEGTIPDVIAKYEESGFFKRLRPNTQRDYRTYLRSINEWSNDSMNPLISDLTTLTLTKFLDQYKDTSEKQLQMKNVLSMLYKVAIREGFISDNLAIKIPLITERKRKRNIVIWTQEDVEKFVAHADQMGWWSIGTAVLIAFETGQRMNDILALQKPRDYDQGKFAFKQSKTGAKVSIAATDYLRPRLDAIEDEQLLLIRHENTGLMWKMHTFTHKVRIIADACGMENHIFKHLRHSARLRAERAGLTEDEMTKTFGWSRDTVKRMGDQHYGVNYDEETATAAVIKLNNYRSNKKGQLHTSRN